MSLNNPLPVTTTFFLPFAAINLALIIQTTRARMITGTFLGNTAHDTSKLPSQGKKKDDGTTTYGQGTNHLSADQLDPMMLATRAHVNFHESVPLALIMAGGVEVQGGSRSVLAGLLGCLVAARMAHAWGIVGNWFPGRRHGAVSTWLIQIALGVWGTVLGVRGWLL